MWVLQRVCARRAVFRTCSGLRVRLPRRGPRLSACKTRQHANMIAVSREIDVLGDDVWLTAFILIDLLDLCYMDVSSGPVISPFANGPIIEK